MSKENARGMQDDTISRKAAIDAIKTSRYLVDAMEKIIKLPSAQPEPKKPEQSESSIAYCSDCIHTEMCSWYPYEDCEWRDTFPEQYARGYNDAKREIALSGEYERAYQRGKEDAEPKWTPCSEGLPKAGVRYQVTFESGEVGYADFRNKIFLFDGSAKENVWETERYYEDDGEVIAWMPRPEPYKEGKDAEIH